MLLISSKMSVVDVGQRSMPAKGSNIICMCIHVHTSNSAVLLHSGIIIIFCVGYMHMYIPVLGPNRFVNTNTHVIHMYNLYYIAIC